MSERHVGATCRSDILCFTRARSRHERDEEIGRFQHENNPWGEQRRCEMRVVYGPSTEERRERDR